VLVSRFVTKEDEIMRRRYAIVYAPKRLRGLRRYTCNKTKRKVDFSPERPAIDSGGIIFTIKL
jgi:hypothetical protein